jgi:hypothetical protein
MRETTSGLKSEFRKLQHSYRCELSRMRHSTDDNAREPRTSEGFTTTLFPAARAGAIFLRAIKRGWLNGYRPKLAQYDRRRSGKL